MHWVLVLHLSWLHSNYAVLCVSLVTGFLLSAQQSGQKWGNIINFYLHFIAFTAGNRPIASSYWRSSKQYVVKKLDYNSLRGSHTPRTSGTHQMLVDIAVNLNWIKGDRTSAVCLCWITLLFYGEQEQGIKRDKAKNYCHSSLIQFDQNTQTHCTDILVSILILNIVKFA